VSRRTRTLIVLAVALVTATVASVGMYFAIQRLPVRQVEVPSAQVVVAKAPIPMGVRLTADHVKVVPWPARSPIEGTFPDVKTVVDRGLVAAVAANEPITETKLAPLAAGAGLPPAIRPGMRAMSVKVNEVIGVAGFVVPGTRVDVLVTIPLEKSSVSRVVVSNVQVLTAGTRYDDMEAKKDGKPIRSTVVTLMVSPTDAERIVLAANEGQIMLALRNPLDTETVQTPGITTAALMPGAAPPPPVRARGGTRPAAPVRATIVIETIKAGKREQQEVIR
jgi:pilus assembly protein CpaB